MLGLRLEPDRYRRILRARQVFVTNRIGLESSTA